MGGHQVEVHGPGSSKKLFKKSLSFCFFKVFFSRQTYFHNALTGDTTYERPTEPAGSEQELAEFEAEEIAVQGGQLWDAAAEGDAAAIERLAAEGASPDAKKYGSPAVYLAARRGHAGAVSALVRLGADLDARGKRGFTALMAAAYMGEVECARALLAGGADRTSTLRATSGSRKGKTALEIAEGRGKAEVAALLRH